MAAVALAGCAQRSPRPAELRLERTDLALMSRTLQQLERPIRGEIAPARAAWPALAHGLPPSIPPAVRPAIATAAAHARALAVPELARETSGLTGPAAGIGALLRSYVILTQRGWQHIAAALAPPTQPAAARFVRANIGLYIYSTYDGHYDLSLIGAKLRQAYAKLGGPAAFGAALTPSQIGELARAYAIPAVRLQPQPPHGLPV